MIRRYQTKHERQKNKVQIGNLVLIAGRLLFVVGIVITSVTRPVRSDSNASTKQITNHVLIELGNSKINKSGTDVSRSETVTIHIQGSVEELQADNGQLQQQQPLPAPI